MIFSPTSTTKKKRKKRVFAFFFWLSFLSRWPLAVAIHLVSIKGFIAAAAAVGFQVVSLFNAVFLFLYYLCCCGNRNEPVYRRETFKGIKNVKHKCGDNERTFTHSVSACNNNNNLLLLLCPCRGAHFLPGRFAAEPPMQKVISTSTSE